MPDLIGLDFETYGSVNLPKHGLARYTEDKLFMPLIGSIAWEEDNAQVRTATFDFVSDKQGARRDLFDALSDRCICAHNAPFEAAVLDHLGIYVPTSRFRDSAVVARAVGAGSSLAAAAPQLLDHDKLEAGVNLIKLFSIPGKYQVENEHDRFDPQVVEDYPDEWAMFREYCELDAELSLRIVTDYQHLLTDVEWGYQRITMEMNQTGWPVDVPTVEEMQRRYLENQAVALEIFRDRHDAKDLNLNSLKQLKAWCGERGIRAHSFAEDKVVKLLAAIEKKLTGNLPLDDPKRVDYEAVLDMLHTKQTLGGSSLKKLVTILDTVVPDPHGGHRLKDQYLHAGAGQTLRTTGRSVQMQNLKRLTHAADMNELMTVLDWDNDKLAENIRQTFTASDPKGRLIVGDFKSVESRGLAYLAGEEWKLDAYRNDLDLYKVLAEKIFDVPLLGVTKEQRQLGKVGELSCGYGAGGQAVVDFAEKMGTHLELAEATKLVWDWRDANPKVVALWDKLNEMLVNVVSGTGGQRSEVHVLPYDQLLLSITILPTPTSLARQHPGAQSIQMVITDEQRRVRLRRIFHGCYLRGRNVGYYKPSDRKTGDLWSNHFTDQKLKQVRFYELYGGKLAGILTQSFCRELFMHSMELVADWCSGPDNQVTLIGQFHDEIVLDWKPGARSLESVKHTLSTLMSDPGFAASFPLAADIKDDYRYTK